MDEIEIALAALHNSPEGHAVTDNTPEIPMETETIEPTPPQPALDKAMIKYITCSYRLLFIEYEDTWQEFHSANLTNLELYADYTPLRLCQHFEQAILPQVYTYDLTDVEKRLFELLELHPEYVRVENGYQRVPPPERVANSRQPKADENYRVVTQTESEAEMFAITPEECAVSAQAEFQPTENANTPLHNFVMKVPYASQRSGHDFKLSPENAALLSAVLSNDFELSGCKLLETKEIHQRLRAAKRDFEQHARMPRNCSDVETLLAKITKLRELRKAIVEVVSNSF